MKRRYVCLLKALFNSERGKQRRVIVAQGVTSVGFGFVVCLFDAGSSG